MRSSVYLFGYLSLFLLLASCSTSYYSPGPAFFPQLSEEGELAGEAMLFNMPLSYGAGGKIAFSPVKNLGVMLGTNLIWEDQYEKNGKQYWEGLQGQRTDLGVGFYKHLHEVVVWDIYTGWSNTKGTNHLFEGYTTEIQYQGLFLQTSIGIDGHEKGKSGAFFGLRGDYLRYTRFNPLAPPDILPLLVSTSFEVKEGEEFFVWGFHMGYHYRATDWLRLQAQAAIEDQTTYHHNLFHRDFWNLSIGVRIDLDLYD